MGRKEVAAVAKLMSGKGGGREGDLGIKERKHSALFPHTGGSPTIKDVQVGQFRTYRDSEGAEGVLDKKFYYQFRDFCTAKEKKGGDQRSTFMGKPTVNCMGRGD